MALEKVTYEQDLSAILTGYRNLEDGRPTNEGSDTYTQSTVLAALSQDVRTKIAWAHDQGFADSADSDMLERHALLRTNITRRAPSSASGQVVLTGEAGTVVPVGSEMIDQNGLEYQLSSAAVVGSGGQVTAEAEAISAGAATNLAAGETLTVTSPPAGLDQTAEVETAWTGGGDEESDAELLARHLWILRHPPAGGNKYDYITWAMSVAGVYQAYHFPRRRGLGTADTCILTDDGDRTAGQALIDEVQALIDLKRPSGIKGSGVYTADLVNVNVTVEVTVASGYLFSTVKPAVETAIAGLFQSLGPGDGLTLAAVQTAISLTPGVADRSVSAPTGNISATVDESTIELLTAGTVTVTEAS